MAYQYTQQDKDYLTYLASGGGMLSLGDSVGNPGYSLAAPTYSTQNYNAGTGQVTGGYNAGPVTQAGAVWMGAPGGDTAENRGLFESYLANNTILGSGRAGGTPNYLPPKSGTVTTQPVGTPVEATLPATTPPVTAQAPQDNPELKKFLTWASGLNPGTGTLSSAEAIVRFGQGAPESQEERDWIANEFYNAVRHNPDTLSQLPPEQQMQYAWLQYEKGLISGNQKDDRIKRIRQEYDMPFEMYGNPDDKDDTRLIARNKIDKEGKRDGISSGDVFQIGDYTQRDTGRDYGSLAQLNNKLAPGFNLNDVANNRVVQAAGLLAAPFTGGVSASVTQGIRAADQRDVGALDVLRILGPLLIPQMPTDGTGGNTLNLVDDTIHRAPEAGGGGLLDKITDIDWRGVGNIPGDDRRDRPYIGNTPVANRPGWHWERTGEPGHLSGWKAVRDVPTTDSGGGGGSTDSGSEAPTGGSTVDGQPTSTSQNPIGGEVKPTEPTEPGKPGAEEDSDWLDLLGNLGYIFGAGSIFGGGSGGTGSTSGGDGDGDNDTGNNDTGNGGGDTGGVDPGPGTGPGSGPGEGPGDGPGEGGGEGDVPGPGSNALASGMLAVGSKQDWKDFQAGINVNFPVLQRLGITPTQYIALLMSRLKQ